MLRRSFELTIVAVALCCVAFPAHATWSIVAVDAQSRTMGAAVTSCVGAYDLRNIVGFEPNYGVVISQAATNHHGREEARRLLRSDVLPSAILEGLRNDRFDYRNRQRQFGIVTVFGEAEASTGAYTAVWSGHRTGRIADRFVYSVQGNILTGESVVTSTERAFMQSTACDLPERLLAALEAGGGTPTELIGDARCTTEDGGSVPSNSAALVVTDWSGTVLASLSVTNTESRSALVALREEFTTWRATHPCR